jgi:hypothetical protein
VGVTPTDRAMPKVEGVGKREDRRDGDADIHGTSG